MSKHSPFVSVIIPTYNSRIFLESAVQSVEAQTFKDYEVIIIDDGSTDGTSNWAAFCQGRFQYEYHENHGQAVARNRGAELAKGELLSFLDADDMWLPEKLEKQVNTFCNTANRSFAFTDGYRLASCITYDQLEHKTPCYPRLSSLYTHPPNSLTLDFEFRINCVPTSSILLYKKDFLSVGGMPDIRQGEDFVFSCLLLLHNPAIYMDEPLFYYRVHQHNISARVRNKRQSFENILLKDNARLFVWRVIKETGLTFPLSRKYARLPRLIRLCLLLLWRITYGSSKEKVIGDLIRYLKS